MVFGSPVEHFEHNSSLSSSQQTQKMTDSNFFAPHFVSFCWFPNFQIQSTYMQFSEFSLDSDWTRSGKQSSKRSKKDHDHVIMYDKNLKSKSSASYTAVCSGIPTVRQNWRIFNAPSLFINCMNGNRADWVWRMSAMDRWRA